LFKNNKKNFFLRIQVAKVSKHFWKSIGTIYHIKSFVRTFKCIERVVKNNLLKNMLWNEHENWETKNIIINEKGK